MKKTRILILLLATIFFTSCKFTQVCPTYSRNNDKGKFKKVERAQRHMARKVYTPGRYYY